jgi:hypothetical protein
MKYTREVVESAVKGSVSIAEVVRKLGLKMTGGSHGHIKSVMKKYGIDTSHFLGRAASTGKTSPKKKAWRDVLLLEKDKLHRPHAYQLRRALIEFGRQYVCGTCGQGGVWNGKPLTLEVHHKNRNFLDNRPRNLQFVCPNCHSQE